MTDRRIDAFFYGLFMDAGALLQPARGAGSARAQSGYSTRLQGVLRKLNFPPEYIAAVS